MFLRNTELRRRVRENEKLARKLASSADPVDVQNRGLALLRIANDLIASGLVDEAERYFADADEILWAFGKLRILIVDARNRQAFALAVQGRFEEAFLVIDELIGRIRVGAQAPGHQEIIYSSTAHWLSLLEYVEHWEKASDGADAVIRVYGASTEDDERRLVAKAFRLRGVTAHARGDHAAALAAFDEAIERSQGRDEEPWIRVRAGSMAKRAAVLADDGLTEDALAACEEVLATFDAMDRPELEEAVTEARELKQSLTMPVKPELE